MFFFFFFKQKTAYEMRISDWSSDVCSSDLQAEQQARLRSRPTHNQLMLPLLGAIAEAGGRARPGDVYDKLAEQLAVPEDVRQQSKKIGRASCRERVCQYV